MRRVHRELLGDATITRSVRLLYQDAVFVAHRASQSSVVIPLAGLEMRGISVVLLCKQRTRYVAPD